MKILILPDIHGRRFWKEVVSEKFDRIIFMGDYLDPYHFEGITEADALENFKEILEYTKVNKNVTLLLGNHDLHYIEELSDVYKCRCCASVFFEMRELLKENWDLFKVATEVENNGRKILLTHAGLTRRWLSEINSLKESLQNQITQGRYDERGPLVKIYNTKFDANGLNSLLQSKQGINLLWTIGYERGGYSRGGSPIWADFSEHDQYSSETANSVGYDYQIFSHSLGVPSIDEWYYGEYFAMIDCRKPFILDENRLSEYESKD